MMLIIGFLILAAFILGTLVRAIIFDDDGAKLNPMINIVINLLVGGLALLVWIMH